MDGQTQKSQVSWWLSCLAISITCCAVLFVIIAGYVGDLKKQVQSDSASIAQLSSQQTALANDLQALKAAQASATAQGIVTPAEAAVPATPTAEPAPIAIPTTSMPPAAGVVPPAVTPPLVPAAEPTPANTPAMPPAAVPTTVPEIPAKP